MDQILVKMGKNYIKSKIYSRCSNNYNAVHHSTNIEITTRSKPCSYIFLKFSDRC